MTEPPRIVSLLPSATEIAAALGFKEEIVGRSHECDFPLWVQRLPICTSTKLEKGLTSVEIEHRVREIVRRGLSVYDVDTDLLRALRPDIILTQSQCAVCAVTPVDLEETLSQWIGRPPILLSLAPDTFTDVWGDIKRVGDATGACLEAERVIDSLKERLGSLAGPERSEGAPTVAAIEWIDPLMIAGNWIPELIESAGGSPLLMEHGQHSSRIGIDALANEDPDFIIFMPCGYRISQSLKELPALLSRTAWRSLRAVHDQRVFVADGHHFFNRPGPRLVESAAIVAAILAAPPSVDAGDGWVRVRT